MQNHLSLTSEMRGWSQWTVAFVCLLASLSWHLRAEAPDLSTPKKAGVAFAMAVEAGDLAKAKTLATGNDEQWQIIQALSNASVAISDLEKSLAKKFGADVKVPPEMHMEIAAGYETADEEITGDTAFLRTKKNPDDKYPMTLKKMGDAWKVDLSNITQDPDGPKAMKEVEAGTQRMRAVISKLDHGDYAGPEQAMAAINSAAGP